MGSKLERLDPDTRIPFDETALLSGDPEQVKEYLLTLVKVLEKKLERMITVANYTTDLIDGEAIYLGLKGSGGDYPNNTWRLIVVNGALEMQKKLSGTWTKIARHNN